MEKENVHSPAKQNVPRLSKDVPDKHWLGQRHIMSLTDKDWEGVELGQVRKPSLAAG